ncbi:hypothetical protein SB659_11175 [Arthrobacter sp. SIMBA_036]|uniref:hypothetical protein n=2 Tax=Bacteria TaxID=2 RepID=UPI00397D51BD
MPAQPAHHFPSSAPAPAMTAVRVDDEDAHFRGSTKNQSIPRLSKRYLHCGVAMHTGTGKRSMLMTGLDDRRVDPDLEAYLTTRVLHCDECGFQMEIPD